MHKRIGKFFISIILLGLVFSPFAVAQESYGGTLVRKLGTGAANLSTGWIEIPKNVHMTINDMDTKYVLFGIIGGTIKGTLHTVGRTLTGAIDLLTFPLPTKPMIKQGYVWRNFGDDTTYGPYFKFHDSEDHSSSSQGMSY